MKGQAPLNLRTRKNARGRASTDFPIRSAKLVDTETSAKAFIAGGEIPWKPSKVEKPIVAVKTTNDNAVETRSRYNTRSASSNQSKLSFTAIDKEPRKPTTKRKSIEINTKDTKKPKVEQRKITSLKREVQKDDLVKETKPTILEKVTKCVKTTTEYVENLEIMHKDKPVESVEAIVHEKAVSIKANITTAEDVKVTKEEKLVEEKEKYVYTPINQEIVDSPSPPSFLTEPATPPAHMSIQAPYKTYITHSDKKRIEGEISTLTKLCKALDIVITDRLARNRPSLYHQIEPVLRNSTGRAVTISHVCKIMYITPKLYTLEAKELRNYGGSVTEAHLIQFGKDWSVPLAGKDLQMRSDMLQTALVDYFATHKEPDATVPQIKLPKLDMVVDKKEWMKKANLPPGIKSLLQAHEKAKVAAIESEKPKPKPTGSVKDRMAALKARLAEKKGSSS